MTKRRWALVESELRLVQAIAYRVARRLPASVDIEDLASIGRLALIRAAERYEASLGVPFGVYARYRVRGAMLDSMRRGNYEFELHEEVAADFEDSPGNNESAGIVVPIDERPNAESEARSREMLRLIRAAIEGLDPAERYAILARAEGESYRAIGQHFGHFESWAYALVERARHKLKRSLAMHRLDDAA